MRRPRTIWDAGAIPVEEWKYRSLKRVWLPLFDLLCIAAGIAAITSGIPALDEVFPPEVVDLLGGTLVGVSIVCLFGIAFPSLYRYELIGKALLVGIIVSYAAALFSLSFHGDQARVFVGWLVLTFLPLPLFRMTLLGEEIRERKDERNE